MKSKLMIKKYKIIILIIFIFFNLQSQSNTEEFFFEGDEIQILNNGNRLISNKKVKISSSDNMVITANEFDYDKLKSELLLKGNVIINDLDNQTIIITEKIKYFRNIEKIFSYDQTQIKIKDKYSIDTKNIIYLRKKREIQSDDTTIVTDKYGNNFLSQKFLFLIDDEVLKGKNVTLKDINENKYYFESFFVSLKNKEFYGKDIKLVFDDKAFGNKDNEPRLYGNTIQGDENKTIISKGIFTTCKKRNGCPPWTIKAKEVIHDKKKKTINYRDAWLLVYDQPILYFPKFFHPDPTVKRQSGFLMPRFSDSANTGISLQLPYFKVLADNKDLTLRPTIFADKKLILQNEYRQVEKNFDHIMDFGLFTSALSNDQQTSKSHFFSNTIINLEDSLFDESNLKVNLEQVSNDTYLKKYKIDSPIINNESLMHSFIEYVGYNDDSFLNLSFETYEDLTKGTHDRYEIIYPNLDFSKDLEKIFDLSGTLSFSSNIYQKQYDTNKYKQNFTNDLLYSAPTKFASNGFLKDYKLLLKNTNDRTKTGYNNESQSKNKLLSQFMYSISYPLKKESELYDDFIKPVFSLRFSPNKTKNISSEDRRLDINNINSFNRISISDGVEGGQSLTIGLEYKKKDKNDNEKISFDLAQVVRDKADPDLPIDSTLNNKYSNIIGRLKFNVLDNLNFEYNFMMDNNFEKTNYNSILAGLSVNNFVTNFEYIEEKNVVGSKSFINNQTSYSFDENNSIKFSTRRNREFDLTEFYNLIYQYENDCLKAAIEYNKTFYNDSDLKPEEEMFFSITIVPFTKLNTTNFKK